MKPTGFVVWAEGHYGSTVTDCNDAKTMEEAVRYCAQYSAEHGGHPEKEVHCCCAAVEKTYTGKSDEYDDDGNDVPRHHRDFKKFRTDKTGTIVTEVTVGSTPWKHEDDDFAPSYWIIGQEIARLVHDDQDRTKWAHDVLLRHGLDASSFLTVKDGYLCCGEAKALGSGVTIFDPTGAHDILLVAEWVKSERLSVDEATTWLKTRALPERVRKPKIVSWETAVDLRTVGMRAETVGRLENLADMAGRNATTAELLSATRDMTADEFVSYVQMLVEDAGVNPDSRSWYRFSAAEFFFGCASRKDAPEGIKTALARVAYGYSGMKRQDRLGPLRMHELDAEEIALLQRAAALVKNAQKKPS